MNGEPYESPIEMLNDPQNNLRLMTGAQFFADGQRLVVSTGMGRCGSGPSIRWKPPRRSTSATATLICTVRLSPDEKRVAFCIDRGSPEDFVCLWDLEGDRLLSRLSSPRINAFAFTKDGKILRPSRGGRFYAWSVADGGLSEPKEITVLGTEAMGIILSADEKSAFIATDAKGGQIVQVRLEDGEWLWASPPLARRVEFLAWLDGDRFVSTSRDGQVTIWRKQNP
ncbi:MAG: WD40 repeat domain-containing protein [Verrucomicrobiales bacterium]